MNQSRFGILIPFSRSVILSRIICIFFAITSNSSFSISIALHCASTIRLHLCGLLYFHLHLCGWLYFRFNNILLSTSVCVVYASTKCYSTTSSSFDFSMNIGSINVAPGPIYEHTPNLLKRLKCESKMKTVEE